MKGTLVYFELPAENVVRARQFWGDLCGWQFQSWDGPMEYHMFEGEPGGAIYPAQQGERGPIVYFGTDDIDKELHQLSSGAAVEDGLAKMKAELGAGTGGGESPAALEQGKEGSA